VLGKSSGVIPLVFSPGIGACYSGFWGEGCCPLLSDSSFFLFFFSTFLGLMGHLLQVGALIWSNQVTGLWVEFGSFCPQGRLQLGPEVTHCQFMQSVQSCCFHHEAGELPYSNSVWLVPPPARRGNSALSTDISPTGPAQWCSTSSALGGWLVALPLLSAFVPCITSAWC
jgi:hypothetical protein